MLKNAVKRVAMLIYYIVGALILETVTHSLLGFGLFPTLFLYNFSIIVVIALFVFLIPNHKVQYTIYTIILGVQTALSITNYQLSRIDNLFTLDMFSMIHQTAEVMTSNFFYFGVAILLVAIFAGIATVGFLALKYLKNAKISLKNYYVVLISIFIIFLQCGTITYLVVERTYINSLAQVGDKNYANSDAYILNTNTFKFESYKTFGSYGYVLNLVFNLFENPNKYITNTINYFNNGEYYNGTYLTNEGIKNDGMFGRAKGENVITIMMESLEWFAFGDGTYNSNNENFSKELTPNIYDLINNERTMLCKGNFAKRLTIYSEYYGILGYYPIAESPTSMAGKNYDSTLNAFGYSLPNMLKTQNYQTSYVHSHASTFYNRDETHKNFGFDVVCGKENVLNNGQQVYKKSKDYNSLDWEHWDAEGDFVQNAMDYIVPQNRTTPFYTFYTTVSTHGGYEYSLDELDCLRYRDYVMFGEDDCELVDYNFHGKQTKIWQLKNTLGCEYVVDGSKWNNSYSEKWEIKEDNTAQATYTNWYKNVLKNNSQDEKLVNERIYYQCGVLGLDEAIGNIVAKLKVENIFDNTTLILYADHNAYYNEMSNKTKGDVTVTELNSVPMIINSNAIKEYANEFYRSRTTKYLVNNRFCSAYDIIPTTLNMLGIKYNTRLYLGQSLFAPCDYVYWVNGQPYDMTIYYSNSGGIMFSRDMWSSNAISPTVVNSNVGEEQIRIFTGAATKFAEKLNYIRILNKAYLYKFISKV